jgi:hypothetical protein
MSTRASAAISSRRAKQELVRLLFGAKYARKGPGAHMMLDPAGYSFTDLRKAYLERLQTIHPDKLKHASPAPINVGSSSDDKPIDTFRSSSASSQPPLHDQFVELQDAWDKYEEVAKMLARVGKPEDANFTLFGVGCSFSDSPQERAMREEIMDQAARGWFSAGGLAETSEEAASMEYVNVFKQEAIPLCDDDLFVTVESIDDAKVSATAQPSTTSSGELKGDAKPKPRKSLIPVGYGAKQR